MGQTSHGDNDSAHRNRISTRAEAVDRYDTLQIAAALFENAEEVGLILDPEGNPMWVSPNVRRLLDIAPEELTNAIGLDLVHPDDRARVQADLATLATPGRRMDAEYRIILHGAVRWIHVTLHNRSNDFGGWELLGNLREVTLQRGAELAVRLEAALLAPSNQAITALDPDGIISYWNDAATEIYGWSAEEAIGRPNTELIPIADGWETIGSAAKADNEQARSWTRELLVVRKDGTRVPVVATATPLLDEAGNHVVTAVVSYDTTENLRSQEIAARLASIVETSQDAIFSTDLSGQITTWNDAATELFGHEDAEVIGQELRVLVADDEQRLKLAELFLKACRGERADSVVTLGRLTDGRPMHVSASMSPIRTGQGALIGVSVIAHDVTDRHRAEQALAHQATHDPLSGLPNRRLFVQKLEESLQRSSLSDLHTGVVYVDLDDFKQVNDVFGHAGGDRLLRDIGQRIAAVMGEDDIVARLGGDEYVAACDGLDGYDALARISTRIRRALSLPFRAGNETVSITASIGVALSGPNTRAEALIRNADIAMYAAKDAGGNQVEIFDDALYAQARRRTEMRAEIDAALVRGDFQTYFQPEVVLEDGSLFGFEALARWIHPTRGFVSPAEFVPMAEQNGAIIRVGQQILRDACRAAGEWQAAVPDGKRFVSVNLSPIQVADPGLHDLVREAIEESGITPDLLCLEVTESALMDFDLAAKAIGGLKDLGVSIAIDDFGTGYSSLSRLKLFPVDFLKIDKSFIDGLGREVEDEAIVSAMIGLSHSLNVEVIAEGIETTAQLDRLREFGCKYGQGYLWSKPVPGDEAVVIASDPVQLRPPQSPG
ncbi:MAG: EAL domain-containing protein [Acidimicrobiales bacterium]|nr:EAL domain-containing protein [Acidimicrobiales bacterium]